MKCKNCGNIFDSNCYACPLCGSNDCVVINNNDNNNNNNIVNDTNILSNLNGNEVVDKSIIKKRRVFKIYVIFSIILSIFLCCLGVLKNKVNDRVYSVIDRDYFDDYFISLGYKINDLKSSYDNYSYLSNYVVSSFNSRSVIYITCDDDTRLGELKDKVINTISKYKINSNDLVLFKDGNLEKYVLESNSKYAVLVMVDDMLMYSIVDLRYKDNLNYIMDDFGYVILDNQFDYILFLISFMILLVLFIVSLFKLFKKTNRSGYYSLIPIYNLYVLNKIVLYNGWLFVFMFIPFVNILYLIWFNYKLGVVFGKKKIYILGLILFPIYFIAILSNDDSIYLGIRK